MHGIPFPSYSLSLFQPVSTLHLHKAKLTEQDISPVQKVLCTLVISLFDLILNILSINGLGYPLLFSKSILTLRTSGEHILFAL